MCADFTSTFSLPIPRRSVRRRVVYFPGSTIGNFARSDALSLLRRMSVLASWQGSVVIGIDLKKDTSIIRAAYNDREGVTAQFNLNLLRRINRELEGDFRLDNYRHEAVYNERCAPGASQSQPMREVVRIAKHDLQRHHVRLGTQLRVDMT